jgi:alpha-D-ribose 1-methylphosphonate 5-triphosphate synthase subunit PhnH
LAERARAAFVVAREMPVLASLDLGTDVAPETAATLILQVAELGAGTSYTLAGPGVRGTEMLRVRGLPNDFVDQWRTNHRLFPRGVDIILCSETQIAALPRSVEVT